MAAEVVMGVSLSLRVMGGLLLVGSVTSAQIPPPARPRTAVPRAPTEYAGMFASGVSAAGFFDLCVNAPLVGPAKTDRELDNIVLGMRKLDGGGWEHTDGTGTARLLDLRDLSLGFNCVFFPSTPEPLAEPVLAALLRTALSVSLRSDPIGVEVVIKRTSSVEDGRSVERRESFTVRGSSLTRRKLAVEWR